MRPCGREVEQLHLLAALRVVDLLVLGRRLVVALVEVRRQEREDVVQPVLVVGAGELQARRPAAADRPEAHRLVVAPRRRHRVGDRLGVRHGLADGQLAGADLVEAAPDRVWHVGVVLARVGVEVVGAAEGEVVGDRHAGEGLGREGPSVAPRCSQTRSPTTLKVL